MLHHHISDPSQHRRPHTWGHCHCHARRHQFKRISFPVLPSLGSLSHLLNVEASLRHAHEAKRATHVLGLGSWNHVRCSRHAFMPWLALNTRLPPLIFPASLLMLPLPDPPAAKCIKACNALCCCLRLPQRSPTPGVFGTVPADANTTRAAVWRSALRHAECDLFCPTAPDQILSLAAAR